MIGLLLITHGTLGESLVQCACHVLNRRPPLVADLGVAAQDDPLDLLPMAQKWLSLVDEGSGVLVLTDIYGATPSNIARKLIAPGRVEAISGVSMPMLLRALNYRERGMQTLVVKAMGGGRDGVMHMKADRDAQG